MPANRLRELREESGLTMLALAEKIGVHESTISRWETSTHGIPDWRKQQLAELLGVSVPFLMGWDDGDDGDNGDGLREAA